jgi:hypothetical protein
MNIITELKKEMEELTADERRFRYLIEETNRCNTRLISNYKEVMIRKEAIENIIRSLEQ